MTSPTTNPALRRLFALAALLVLVASACSSDNEESTAADAVAEPVLDSDEEPESSMPESTPDDETAPQDDDAEQQQEDEPEQEAEAKPSTPENEAAPQADEPDEQAEPEPGTLEDDAESEADEPQEQTVSDAAAAIDDPLAAAAAKAFALVYDSDAPWVDKAPHLENAAALESSNAAYAAAGEQMGGIALDPTAAEVTGDTATVTYDVLFGGNPAYENLTRPIMLVDGVWVVSEAEYCGFLASARTPCS